jgi:hypothetical protein
MQEALRFHYIFKFLSGNSRIFEVQLDPESLNFVVPESNRPRDWAKLLFHQCDNCPLDHEKHLLCPIAANIGNLIEAFDDVSPFETAHVTVLTKQRDISKTTTVQEGLGSLLGIYMATCGCPVMEKLKPLVRYHLPFAALEEQVVRVTSTYLLIQHFLMKKGIEPDWKLGNLQKIYDDINKVNAGFSRRLRHAAARDASLAAIEGLDSMASLIPFVITDTLEQIESSLNSYIRRQ